MQVGDAPRIGTCSHVSYSCTGNEAISGEKAISTCTVLISIAVGGSQQCLASAPPSALAPAPWQPSRPPVPPGEAMGGPSAMLQCPDRAKGADPHVGRRVDPLLLQAALTPSRMLHAPSAMLGRAEAYPISPSAFGVGCAGTAAARRDGAIDALECIDHSLCISLPHPPSPQGLPRRHPPVWQGRCLLCGRPQA